MTNLKRKLGTLDAGRVLDVATGDGSFIDILLESVASFVSVVGIDVDENELSEARRAIPDRRVELRRADATQLPFRDNSFDTVSISDALHHLADADRAMSEMVRVLRPGGTIIIHEMVGDGLTPAQQVLSDLHHVKAEVDTLLGISHRKTLTRDEIRDIVARAKVVKRKVSEYVDHFPDPMDVAEIERRIEFINAYLEHIAEMAEPYARIRKEVFRIKEHAYRHGIDRPPQLLIIANKRG